MDLKTLEDAVRGSWSKETCYPGCANEWNEANPAFGQCAVTALVVQDYLGGTLLYCQHQHHYWNSTVRGEEVDFTREQFPPGTVVCLDEIKPRKHVLESDSAIKALTPQRYSLLKQKVEKKLYDSQAKL
jgi:hypothetical protein